MNESTVGLSSSSRNQSINQSINRNVRTRYIPVLVATYVQHSARAAEGVEGVGMGRDGPDSVRD
jgi:hypothetical protein